MPRVLITAVVVVAIVSVVATGASGAPGSGDETGKGGAANGVITASVSYVSGGSSAGSSSNGSSQCSWTMVDGEAGAPDVGVTSWPLEIGGVTHHLWSRTCPDGSTLFSIPEREPRDLLPQLLEQLRDRALPKPTPVFQLLDPTHGWAYVRTPLDFRAGDSWRPVSVTATLGPLWATVTATPVRLTFDPGDPGGPGPVSCDGDGPVAPYVAAIPGACSYTYLNASSTSPVDGYHFRTRSTIEWAISWTSSTGAGGPLEPYSTEADALLAVAEVKGLVTCTGPRPEQGGC
jgi:hypothetical protein